MILNRRPKISGIIVENTKIAAMVKIMMKLIVRIIIFNINNTRHGSLFALQNTAPAAAPCVHTCPVIMHRAVYVCCTAALLQAALRNPSVAANTTPPLAMTSAMCAACCRWRVVAPAKFTARDETLLLQHFCYAANLRKNGKERIRVSFKLTASCCAERLELLLFLSRAWVPGVHRLVQGRFYMAAAAASSAPL